jgi:hypothetical protein
MAGNNSGKAHETHSGVMASEFMLRELDERMKAFQDVADLIVTTYQVKNGEVPDNLCFENNGELIDPAVMFTNLTGSLKVMAEDLTEEDLTEEDLVCNSPSKKQKMETTTRPYAAGTTVLTQKDQDAPIKKAIVDFDDGGDHVFVSYMGSKYATKMYVPASQVRLLE